MSVPTPSQVFQRLVDLVDGRSKTELVSVDLFYLSSGRKTPKLIDGRIEAGNEGENTGNSLSGILLNYYLEQALQRKLISPNRVLVQSIATAQTEEDIIPIALALRNGAGSNIYVEMRGYGNIHILALLHLKLSGDKSNGQVAASPQIVNMIALILIVMGSDPKSPVFDKNSKKTIPEWLLSEWSINSILPQLINIQINQVNLLKIVRVETMNRLAIYLDRPEWIQPFTPPIPPASGSIVTVDSGVLSSQVNQISNTQRIYQMALYCRSNNILDFLVVSINGGDLPENFFILSVYYLMTSHSINLIRQGYKMTYLDVNRLMYQWKIFLEKEQLSAAQALESTILVAIQHGTSLDAEQVNLIPLSHRDNLIKTYSKPLWEKKCSGSNSNNPSQDSDNRDDLVNLAITLGLDPNGTNEQICQAISQLSLADPDKLKEAVIKRQRTRIAVNASTPREFIDAPSLTGLGCQNIDLLDQNPYRLIDFDVVSYRDGNNQVWCFTSDQFENLLRSGKNPYNNQLLPSALINQIESQRRTVKRLGLPVDRPSSINTEQLIIPEVIGNSASQRILQDVDRMMALAGIDLNRIQNLTPSDYVKLSKVIGLQDCTPGIQLNPKCLGIETTLIDWEPLTPLHRRYTFSHMIWNQIKDHQINSANLFKIIQVNLPAI